MKILLWLVAVFVFFSTATIPSFSATEIYIGLMCPLTGKWASEGEDTKNIVTLLAKNINDSGGIEGKKIKLFIEDDAGDPRTAALAAQKLLSSHVVAIIGTYGSSVTEATQKIISDAKVLQIATGATSARLTEKKLPLFFRVSPRDTEQGKIAADVIAKKGYKSVAVVHDNSSYSKGLAQEAVKNLKAQGISIVFFDALTPGEQDYTPILTTIRSTNPDLILYTGYYNEAGLLLRQKFDMNWAVNMMGGDGTNNMDLVKIAGIKAAQNFFFISPPSAYDLTSPVATAFFSEYKRIYGALPDSIWSVFAGDAFICITEALKQGIHPDAQSIAQVLKTNEKDCLGLTGLLAFTPNGDRVGTFYNVYCITDKGTFVQEGEQ